MPDLLLIALSLLAAVTATALIAALGGAGQRELVTLTLALVTVADGMELR